MAKMVFSKAMENLASNWGQWNSLPCLLTLETSNVVMKKALGMTTIMCVELSMVLHISFSGIHMYRLTCKLRYHNLTTHMDRSVGIVLLTNVWNRVMTVLFQ